MLKLSQNLRSRGGSLASLGKNRTVVSGQKYSALPRHSFSTTKISQPTTPLQKGKLGPKEAFDTFKKFPSSTFPNQTPKQLEKTATERLESFDQNLPLVKGTLNVGDRVNAVHPSPESLPSLNYVAPDEPTGTAEQTQNERGLPKKPAYSTNFYALRPQKTVEGTIGPQKKSDVFEKDVPGGESQIVPEGNRFTSGFFGTNAHSILTSIQEAEDRRTGGNNRLASDKPSGLEKKPTPRLDKDYIFRDFDTKKLPKEKEKGGSD